MDPPGRNLLLDMAPDPTPTGPADGEFIAAGAAPGADPAQPDVA